MTVVNSGGKSGLFMRYSTEQTIDTLTSPTGTPGPVTFFFVVPDGTQLKQVNASGQQVPINLTAQ
jgi:hypothetical protein